MTQMTHRFQPLPDFPGFTSVDREIRVDRLPVTGALPGWLTGTLIRNGPGKFEVGDYRVRHWFNGLALLHAFCFRDGQVSYANRYVRSVAYQHAVEKEQLYGKQFGPDPCASLFSRHFTEYAPNLADNAAISVTRIADRFVALSDAALPMEFDPRTLETRGVFEYGNSTPLGICTPHPHRDFDHGGLFNYGTVMGEQSAYRVFMVPDGSTAQQVVATVPRREPCYMHSFGMTENYLILAEFPVVLDPIQYLDLSQSVLECMRWEPERGTRFLIVDKRDGSIVRTLTTEGFFAFHHINAFERGGDVVLDITATRTPYETVLGLPPTTDQLDIERYGYSLRRYVLPLSAGPTEIEHQMLSTAQIEMPRINYARYNTKEYRYVYGLSRAPDARTLNQLTKVDVVTGDTVSWYERGRFPGEPVFVAAPDSTREDDGVVLSAVLDVAKGTSFMLVLDGATFGELARAELPQHMPSDLHGDFFPDVV